MTERGALLMLLSMGYTLAWRSSQLQKITDILADLPEGSQSVSIDYHDKDLILIWDCSGDRISNSPLWQVRRRRVILNGLFD